MDEEKDIASGEDKKKYKVVDKRFSLEDEEEGAAREETAGDASVEQEAQTEDEEPRQAPGGGAEHQHPEIRIHDAVRMSMNMIRENVFFSLGLLISKNRPKVADLEAAGATAELFGKLVDDFAEKLGDDELAQAQQNNPGILETLDFVFRMMQGQVYMFLGLIPNPTTGLVAKDLEQARLGIDFCNSLLDHATPLMDDARAKMLRSVVSEMKMNYVNQQNMTP